MSGQPTNLRGYRPETTGLTWRFAGRTFPLVFGAYFLGIAAVHGLFLVLPHAASPYRMLAFVLVLVPISVGYLYPFMLRQMGSSTKEERRESTWANSFDAAKLAGRQSGRYLAVAFPVELLAMASSSFAVAAVFHAFGLK